MKKRIFLSHRYWSSLWILAAAWLFFYSVAVESIAAEGLPNSIDLEPVEYGSSSDRSDFSDPCAVGWGFCQRAGRDAPGDKEAVSTSVKAESPGGVGSQLSLDTNVNVNTSGQAGGRATVVGLGRSSEETDARALGISLNPPQGGGFDLSSFPSSIWNAWSYREGASGSGASLADVRSPSGQVEFLPWTAAALLRSPGDSSWRLLQSASTLNLYESSVGWVSGSRSLAAWAGWTSGGVQGPALSLSWMGRETFEHTGVFDAHLLFADLQSEPLGSESFPTPGATQRSLRLIPVAGWTRRTSGVGTISVRGFADWGAIDYSAPSLGYGSNDDSQRVGASLAMKSFSGQWNWGLSAEQSRLQQTSQSAHSEWVGQAWTSARWEGGAGILWEPTVRWAWVSSLESRGGPQADLNVTYPFASDSGTFSTRFGTFLRVPSLLNRFYESPFFEGNPSLSPERVWSVRSTLGRSFWQLAAFAEIRENALVTTGVSRPFNAGSASLAGGEFKLKGELIPAWLEAEQSIRWTHSRVGVTGESFPLVPDWSASGQLRCRVGRQSLALLARAVSDFASGLGPQQPGFALWTAEWEWHPSVERFSPRIAVRIENLFDRAAAWIPDYPLPGRVFSVALSSELE